MIGATGLLRKLTITTVVNMERNNLILSTGNSIRSQIAEGFLRSFDPELMIFLVGTDPTNSSHLFDKIVCSKAMPNSTPNQ